MVVSPYAKSHLVADTIRTTPCVNAPALSGNLKAEIQELEVSMTYKAATEMVAKIVLLNGRLTQMTGESISDSNLMDLLFQKLRRNVLLTGACRRITDA